MRARRLRISVAIPLLLLGACVSGEPHSRGVSPPSARARHVTAAHDHWVAAWTSAPAGTTRLDDNTSNSHVQFVPATGGRAIRLVLSDRYAAKRSNSALPSLADPQGFGVPLGYPFPPVRR